MAKPLEKQQARKLRQQGKSIKVIAKIIGVSTSTVSRWVNDIELSHEQKNSLAQSQKQWASQNKGAQKNRKNAENLRLTYQNEGRRKAREMNYLHMQGCMLYWAEGSKDKNRLEFVNSDKNMMKLFITFLRSCLHVSNEQITVRVHCHSDSSSKINEIKIFWSRLLEMPLENFAKTQVKKGSNSRKNHLEHGICALRVENTQAVQHIFGAIQEYGEFDNPDWLF